MPESTTEPTLALTLHEILGYLFPVVKYTHIQTIHTYTYIYIQYMQYMHIQAHTCMRQSRSEGVFGGLWQTLYVSGDDETSPIGWGGAWDRVDKLGSGLEHHAAVRGGAVSKGPPTGEEGGGARNRVVGGYRDGVKKCLRP